MNIKDTDKEVVVSFDCESDDEDIKEPVVSTGKSTPLAGPLTGKKVCLSGTFIKKKEKMERYIKSLGGYIAESAAESDYYVYGDNHSVATYASALRVNAESKTHKIIMLTDQKFYSLLRKHGIEI
jgi:NAD-dependent DNA ligase